MTINIDSQKLTADLDALGAISSEPSPVVTRVVFSEADLRARKLMKRFYADAGLAVREDPVGNTFARWQGSDSKLAPVATGSHIDAIPNAGMYDGTVGVLGGLEAIRALKRSGFCPRRSIDLICFTAEEPTRFGVGCLGSRIMSSVLDPSCGETLKDEEGRTLNDVRTGAHFHGALASVAVPRDHYAAFVELHIEQGPILEQKQMEIGIVRAIAAPACLRMEIEGEGGHAGAFLMPNRRDAFLAAAEIALAVEAAAKGTGSIDSVGTVGICDIFPRAVNSVPSGAQMMIDVRDIDLERRNGMLKKITEAASTTAERRKVKISMDTLNLDPPAQCDSNIIQSLERACAKHKITPLSMISRAYHDTLFMSLIAPSAMVFIPCRGGVSHRPDEYATPEHIAQGTLVIAEALAELAA